MVRAKLFDILACAGAAGVWTSSRVVGAVMRAQERRLGPSWAPAELPQSRARSRPALGVPRTATSVCPGCNREAVDAVLRDDISRLEFAANPGLVGAAIVEESGRVLMRKTCDIHGPCEDVLSTDAAFFRRIESLYVGRDVDCADDRDVHDHGVVSIRTGRGLALIVDLTNRCNLKCSPCFMDANHAPYVHELSMDNVRGILERARAVKPRRDFNILFAGGEPTIARNFLDAVGVARSLGFKRICVVTNGIRFAQEPEFAAEARAAGVHQVYLQLDGVSNESHWHRGAANLFDVKRRALENIAAAGMMVNLQVAVANGLNNQHVGDVVRFALQNLSKVRSVLFQPIMFAGRDADVTDDERRARRYTLADLAHDLQKQTPSMDWQPMRDWFPTSAFSVFANYFDHLHAGAASGSIYADPHPDQAMFSPLVVNQRTGCVVPISSFVNVERLLKDVVAITDDWRGATWGRAQMALAVVRNYEGRRAPQGFRRGHLFDLLSQFEPRFKAVGNDWSARDNADPEWRLLTISASWFQDLFNFDLAAAQMDSTPVATVEGEIGFSAYNALGWRKIIEHRHQTATLAEWHRTQGRHRIYANGAVVQLRTRAEIEQAREAFSELVGG
jgi:7,8-dihydro-6-hydroxymethylpterin dimethyltransferase